jgi:hypothetical protein
MSKARASDAIHDSSAESVSWRTPDIPACFITSSHPPMPSFFWRSSSATAGEVSALQHKPRRTAPRPTEDELTQGLTLPRQAIAFLQRIR